METNKLKYHTGCFFLSLIVVKFFVTNKKRKNLLISISNFYIMNAGTSEPTFLEPCRKCFCANDFPSIDQFCAQVQIPVDSLWITNEYLQS